jgi:predicted 2-oxoglutarate/Fe(II)-dependent dioxygenase YbiX
MQREVLLDRDIFLIHDFLSAEECLHYIAFSEREGFDDAPITTSGGPVMAKNVRNNDRVMVDDPALAAVMYERAAPMLMSNYLVWRPVNFNERWRFYRYDPGQRFAPHYDGTYERDNGERSFFTFMIYLNEEMEGGETVFHRLPQGATPEGSDTLRVKPKSGTALVFRHKLLHEGAPILKGRKYVMRTDLMFAHDPSLQG